MSKAERSITPAAGKPAALGSVEAVPAGGRTLLPAGLASGTGGAVTGLLSRVLSDAHVRWVVAVVVLALVVRIVWVVMVNPNPADGRWDDTVFYDGSANNLVEGKGYISFEQNPTARWPIGYSALIAPLYFVFGHNIMAPKALNVFLGGATVLAVYVLGARLFDRRVGLAAAALLAFFPSQIFFSTLIMTEVFFAALLTTAVLLTILWTLPREAERRAPASANGSPVSEGTGPLADTKDDPPAAYKLLLLGLLLGYASITRGEGGVLVATVLLIWWLARIAWRPFLRRSVLMLAGVVLVVAPWTIRNVMVFHAPVFVSTAMGYALWQGNRADAFNPHDWGFDVKFLERYANVPYPEKEVKMNSAETREAIGFIVHNPGTDVVLLFKKLYHLYQDDASGLTWIDHHLGKPSIHDSLEGKLETVANSYYFVVLGWGILTAPFWFSFRDRWRFLLPLTLAVVTLSHLAFITEPRYHFAFIPIICVLAAQGVVALWGRRPQADGAGPAGAGGGAEAT